MDGNTVREGDYVDSTTQTAAQETARDDRPNDARLRELASKATPGPWEYLRRDKDPGPMVVTEAKENGKRDKIVMPPILSAAKGAADAAYIAAAHPTAILALLDEKAALREAAKNAADGLSLSTVMGNPVVQAAIARLRAALGGTE